MLGTVQQREIIAFLNQLKPVYAVGGAVRDHLLGVTAKDLDVVIDLPLDQVKASFNQSPYVPHLIGARQQTLSVFTQGARLDIASLQDHDLVRDAKRRDFTINAIYYRMDTGEILDPLEGRIDLKEKLLRACSTPEECISSDPARILRMVRMAVKFQLKIEPDLWAETTRRLFSLEEVAVERVSEELAKILISREVAAGLDHLDALGYWQAFIPELARLKGLEQNRYHKMDAWEHTKQVVCNTPAQLSLRIAALFHDLGKWDTASRECRIYGKIDLHGQQYGIGKFVVQGKELQRWKDINVEILGARLDHHPDTIQVKRIKASAPCKEHFEWIEDGKRHFLGHEKQSAHLARNILKRYRFKMFLAEKGSRGEEEIVSLIKNHMLGTLTFMQELKGNERLKPFAAKTRKFIWEYGWTGRDFEPERLENLLELWRADFCGGKRHEPEEIGKLDLVIENIRREIPVTGERYRKIGWESFEKFAADKRITGERYGRLKAYVRHQWMLKESSGELEPDILEKLYNEFVRTDKKHRKN